MTNINTTYAKLRKGDKKLTKIMDELIEYRMTNGRKSSHVKNIMEYPSLNNRAIFMICLCLAAFAAAIYLYFFLEVHQAFIPVVILGGMVVIITITNLSSQKRFIAYDDVNRVLNALPPEAIAEAYYKHHPKTK